jgi:hypothetical protein
MISLKEISAKQTVFAKLVIILMGRQQTYTTTIHFFGEGIMAPAAGIARLKKAGVQIDTVYGTVVDANGTSHDNVAHYKIVGGVAP